MKFLTGLVFFALALGSSAMAADSSSAMTGGDLQQICTGQSAESKAACRFYILGITQGVTMGMSIADGKTNGGRPCIPEDVSGSDLELDVKIKLGQDLMVYPEDKKLDASGIISAILIKTFTCQKAR
jgi:hypothetical protein